MVLPPPPSATFQTLDIEKLRKPQMTKILADHYAMTAHQRSLTRSGPCLSPDGRLHVLEPHTHIFVFGYVSPFFSRSRMGSTAVWTIRIVMHPTMLFKSLTWHSIVMQTILIPVLIVWNRSSVMFC